jgi:hypothetical protein
VGVRSTRRRAVRRARHRIGKHYAGPHWESTDGSKVVAAVKERADAPAAGAIPWLLLTAKSVGPAGSFSQGKRASCARTPWAAVAPRSGCSQAAAGTSRSRRLHGGLLLLRRQVRFAARGVQHRPPVLIPGRPHPGACQTASSHRVSP